jgi:fructose-1,6-bisphosphatase
MSPSSNKQLRKKKLNTYARYLEVESWKNPENRALEPVLRSIGEACKQITRIVQRAQTDDLYGVASENEETNVQGEIQQKLDVVCNNIMLKQFCGSTKGVIAAVASEEEDTPRTCCDIMVQ